MWSSPRVSLSLIAAAALGTHLAGCGTDGPSIVGDDQVDPTGPDASVGDGDPDGGGPGTPDAMPDDSPDAEPPSPDANPMPQTLTACATGGDYTTVGAALAAASAGDTIEVCAGTYHERLVIDGKAIFLTGTGGPAATILDGDGAGVVLTVKNTTGAGVVVSGFTFQNGASSVQGGAVRCDDSTFALSNSRITASHALGGGGLAAMSCALDVGTTQFDHNEGGPHGGGALVMTSTGSIHHSWFIENTAREGGGLVSFEGDVSILFNEIRANTASLRGGGLFHVSDAEISSNAIVSNIGGWVAGGAFIAQHAPLIQFNEIRANSSANDGGGIYFDNSSVVFRANLVKANVGGDDGGGVRSFESHCTLEGNTIEDNTTEDGGGGVRISHVPCLVVDNIVRNNHAKGTGGGFDLDNDASTIRGGEITGNVADGSGGGIFTWLAPWTGTTIENVKITNNRAWKGAGIRARWNYKPLTLRGLTITGNHAGLGGGIMIESTNYTISDSLIANNKADTGAGIYHALSAPFDEAECGTPTSLPCPPLSSTGTISQSVIYGNVGAGAALAVGEGGLTVTSVILAGHAGAAVQTIQPTDPMLPSTPPPTWKYNDAYPATFDGMAPPTGHDGNLEVDPAFVDAAAGDFHLAADSACIEAGDPQFAVSGVMPDIGLAGGAP